MNQLCFPKLLLKCCCTPAIFFLLLLEAHCQSLWSFKKNLFWLELNVSCLCVLPWFIFKSLSKLPGLFMAIVMVKSHWIGLSFLHIEKVKHKVFFFFHISFVAQSIVSSPRTTCIRINLGCLSKWRSLDPIPEFLN